MLNVTKNPSHDDIKRFAASLYNEVLSSTTNFYGLSPVFQRRWIKLAEAIVRSNSKSYVEEEKLC